MTRSTSRISTAILVSVLGLVALPASAQGSKQEAVTRYKEGRALIEKKQYEEALRELSASYEMLDSPNTLLLMAHAERELGRKAEAAALYEKVIADANDRVARGEERFEKTAADAQGWLDKLSQNLGKITISVSGAPEGTTVRVDGKAVDAARTSEDTMKVDAIWWTAGTVKVEATTADGATRSMNAEIPKGGPATVALDLGDSARDQAPPPVDDAASFDSKNLEGKSIPTASWVTGGIGVAGLATFAIFGSMAKSKSSDLDACSPRCPESERDVADAGKRDQTVANVGLAVGGIGLAAAAGFYIFQSSEPEAGTVDVGVAPTGVLVRGTF
jgi:hypothetical protein